jgi:hypothetical protein
MALCTASRVDGLRPRAGALVAAIGPLLAACALALGAGAASAQVPDGQLLFNVERNGSIRLTLLGGTPVGTAPIPPGNYSVIVRNEFKDPEGSARYIYLSGPGVQLAADANQGEQDDTTFTFAFHPNATYTWSDGANPSVGGVFRTSTSGSPGADAGSFSAGGGSAGSSKSGAAAKPPGPVLGTLQGKLTRTGKLTLTYGGKAVSARALKQGRYTIVVVDQNRTQAFSVQRAGKPGITVTGLPFVGKKTVTIQLDRGKWSFYSTIYRQHRFVVT